MTHTLTPFRWYFSNNATEAETVQRQFIHRTGTPSPLLSPYNALLPFQAFINGPEAVVGDLTVVDWELVDVATGVRTSISSAIPQIQVFQNFTGIWYIFAGGAMNIPGIAGRTFYSVLHLQSGRFFVSEHFSTLCSAADIDNYSVLRWSHECDTAGIVYQFGYRNMYISPSVLDEPEPVLYEEGTENGLKQFFPTLHIQYTQWRFQDLCMDVVFEALAAIRMHEIFSIERKTEFGTFRARDVRAEWSGDMALVTMQVEDLERTVSGGCCGNMVEASIFPPDLVADTFTIQTITGVASYTSPHSVLANDSGATLQVTGIANVAVGYTVNMQPDGTFVVSIPSTVRGRGGTCTFEYTATDRFGATATAQVTVNFLAVP